LSDCQVGYRDVTFRPFQSCRWGSSLVHCGNHLAGYDCHLRCQCMDTLSIEAVIRLSKSSFYIATYHRIQDR
jgi:hypothetical protein